MHQLNIATDQLLDHIEETLMAHKVAKCRMQQMRGSKLIDLQMAIGIVGGGRIAELPSGSQPFDGRHIGVP